MRLVLHRVDVFSPITSDLSRVLTVTCFCQENNLQKHDHQRVHDAEPPLVAVHIASVNEGTKGIALHQ